MHAQLRQNEVYARQSIHNMSERCAKRKLSGLSPVSFKRATYFLKHSSVILRRRKIGKLDNVPFVDRFRNGHISARISIDMRIDIVLAHVRPQHYLRRTSGGEKWLLVLASAVFKSRRWHNTAAVFPTRSPRTRPLPFHGPEYEDVGDSLVHRRGFRWRTTAARFHG